MSKNRLNLIFKVSIIALIIIGIFICFCPFILIPGTFNDLQVKYHLDGFSLLVDGSKALYIDIYDTGILQDFVFQKSNIFIASFSLLIIELAIISLPLLFNFEGKVKKVTYPLFNIVALINIILSCLIYSKYLIANLNMEIGYGLILFAIINVVIFIAVTMINLLLFLPLKKLKD